MQHVVQWLKDLSGWGIPHWTLVLIGVIVVAEWALGRSSNPSLRSIAAVLATLLRFLVVRSRLSLIPLIGPLLVYVLEAISGKDLDGDGSVASAPDPGAASAGGTAGGAGSTRAPR